MNSLKLLFALVVVAIYYVMILDAKNDTNGSIETTNKMDQNQLNISAKINNQGQKSEPNKTITNSNGIPNSQDQKSEPNTTITNSNGIPNSQDQKSEPNTTITNSNEIPNNRDQKSEPNTTITNSNGIPNNQNQKSEPNTTITNSNGIPNNQNQKSEPNTTKKSHGIGTQSKIEKNNTSQAGKNKNTTRKIKRIHSNYIEARLLEASMKSNKNLSRYHERCGKSENINYTACDPILNLECNGMGQFSVCKCKAGFSLSAHNTPVCVPPKKLIPLMGKCNKDVNRFEEECEDKLSVCSPQGVCDCVNSTAVIRNKVRNVCSFSYDKNNLNDTSNGLLLFTSKPIMILIISQNVVANVNFY